MGQEMVRGGYGSRDGERGEMGQEMVRGGDGSRDGEGWRWVKRWRAGGIWVKRTRAGIVTPPNESGAANANKEQR